MLESNATPLVGQFVVLDVREHDGETVAREVEVHDVGFVALRGPCLITDRGDVRLDRVVGWRPVLGDRGV